ncbi:hypothetical protein FA048_01535 [Pedobacter polaris]|uniref:TonB-dependent receptor plug domain-containing protein n=1 Tax=Pedobacter polaris TaxID=2571273 RepID=A0A4U1CYE8_9SPHI|nr:TonB-dependent receptor plug domain-containing protein [Pedobacter polaris]TKC12328.1 hypothetical protein FA048_01535 [Pedobacter polaris]
MKNTLKLSILSLIALVILGFRADDTPLEKLLKQIAKITATYPQEKVHLHFDKPYYTVGEDIWLKAYLVTAEKNEPSLLSAVLYVDLIDSQNTIRKKLTLSVDKGFASGNISLLDSLGSGMYRARAYTNYMRNYSNDLFFEKFITIGNILDTKSSKKVDEKKLDLNIQFFPEGGNLINGIRSKVGFKAVTSDGMGANVSGYIINKDKEKVAEFFAEHAGMGIFALTPQPNEQYKAIVTLADNTTESFKLPNVLESGQALAVNSVAENLSIRISSTADLINGKDVFVVTQVNGTVYASFNSKVDKAVLSANIPKSSFPTGIVQVTLFNADSKPIAERLIFVNHNDQLKIEILNAKAAATKKKMNLALNVKDLAGNPIDGNFSVSVTDLGKTPFDEDEEKTILSNLLLTSDLKGFIEKPNYYFNTANSDREKHLDNLLLTQGWSRFIWSDIVANKEPDITFRPEQSLEIAGKINTWGDKPLPNAKIIMFSNTPGYTLILDTLSDARGNFVFDRLEIPDSASFIIQSKSNKDNKNINLVLNKTPQVAEKKYIGNTVDIATYIESTKTMFNELNKFNMLDKSIQLQAVNITGKRVLKPLINIPNSANSSGAADQVIKSEKLMHETSILTAFSKIPGVLIKNGMIMRASTRTVSLTQAQQPMLVILDGVYIRQAEQSGFISSLNPSDVEGIEVLTSNYNTSIYGEDGYWGIVFITTKNGSTGKNPPSTNTSSVRNRGFTATKQFYSPNYDDPKTNQQIQDLRTTIYWNPTVITNEKGQADFNFFNASMPGTYRVSVEGMDVFGNIGRKIYTYEVK